MSGAAVTVVLFNAAGRQVARLSVPPDANIIDYAGAFYVLSDEEVQVDDVWVPVFNAPVIHKAD